MLMVSILMLSMNCLAYNIRNFILIYKKYLCI